MSVYLLGCILSAFIFIIALDFQNYLDYTVELVSSYDFPNLKLDAYSKIRIIFGILAVLSYVGIIIEIFLFIDFYKWLKNN